ncbi:unnamed protein product [Calypogeia fissa]
MSRPKPQTVQKFYKSGTPIATTPNPRARIIKGPTTRKPKTEHSPRFDARAEAAYGMAMTAGPNDTARIEEYLASQYQKVLLVKKMGGMALTPHPQDYPPSTDPTGITRTISSDPQAEESKEDEAEEDSEPRIDNTTESSVDQVHNTEPEFFPENEEAVEILQNPQEFQQMKDYENNDAEVRSIDLPLESDGTYLPSGDRPLHAEGDLVP